MLNNVIQEMKKGTDPTNIIGNKLEQGDALDKYYSAIADDFSGVGGMPDEIVKLRDSYRDSYIGILGAIASSKMTAELQEFIDEKPERKKAVTTEYAYFFSKPAVNLSMEAIKKDRAFCQAQVDKLQDQFQPRGAKTNALDEISNSSRDIITYMAGYTINIAELAEELKKDYQQDIDKSKSNPALSTAIERMGANLKALNGLQIDAKNNVHSLGQENYDIIKSMVEERNLRYGALNSSKSTTELKAQADKFGRLNKTFIARNNVNQQVYESALKSLSADKNDNLKFSKINEEFSKLNHKQAQDKMNELIGVNLNELDSGKSKYIVSGGKAEFDIIGVREELMNPIKLDRKLYAFYQQIIFKSEMFIKYPEQIDRYNSNVTIMKVFGKDLEVYKEKPDNMKQALQNLGAILIKDNKISKSMLNLLSHEGVAAEFIKNSFEDKGLIGQINSFKPIKSAEKRGMVTALIKEPKMFNWVSASLDSAINDGNYKKNSRAYAKRFNAVNEALSSSELKNYVGKPEAAQALGHLIIDKSKSDTKLDKKALALFKNKPDFAKKFVDAYNVDPIIVNDLPQKNRFGTPDKRDYIVNMASYPVIHKELLTVVKDKMGASDVKINTDFCNKFNQLYDQFQSRLIPYQGNPGQLHAASLALVDMVVSPNQINLSLNEEALKSLKVHSKALADNAALNPDLSKAVSDNLKSVMKGNTFNEYFETHKSLTMRLNSICEQESKNGVENLYANAAVKVMMDLSTKPALFSKKFDLDILSAINTDNKLVTNIIKYPGLVKTISDALDSNVKLPIEDKITAINSIMSGLSVEFKLVNQAEHANKVDEIVESSIKKGSLFKGPQLKEDMLEYYAKKACDDKVIEKAGKIVSLLPNTEPSKKEPFKKDIVTKNMAEVIEQTMEKTKESLSTCAHNFNTAFGNYELKANAASLLRGSETAKEFIVNIVVNPTLADALGRKEALNDDSKMKTLNSNFKIIGELMPKESFPGQDSQLTRQVIKELKEQNILKEGNVIDNKDIKTIKDIQATIENCKNKLDNVSLPHVEVVVQNKAMSQHQQQNINKEPEKRLHADGQPHVNKFEHGKAENQQQSQIS